MALIYLFIYLFNKYITIHLLILQVYWQNGAQISSPHDKEILRCIEDNVEPWPKSWNDDLVDSSSLRKDPLKDICCWYMEDLGALCFYRYSFKPLLGRIQSRTVHEPQVQIILLFQRAQFSLTAEVCSFILPWSRSFIRTESISGVWVSTSGPCTRTDGARSKLLHCLLP